MTTIAIIGAGAAGLMAASTILEKEDKDIHIHLFEKNTSPGKKVIISGGGRCNVTTGIEDKKILETKYVRGWSFIRKAMGKFSPRKCREWFETHNIPMKCEDDGRVFPVSDDGRDIVGVFEGIFAKYRDKISLHYGEGISEVSVIFANAEIHILDSETSPEGQKEKYLITTPKGSYETDVLIVTTGGNAYSHTGSTGDGYAFARSLGHTVTKLGPSLSSFLTGEKWLHNLSGLSFEKAKISFLSFSEGESLSESEKSLVIIRDSQQHLTGPLLLTHFGISGPLAFMTSAHLAWEEIGKGKEKSVNLAPLSDMTYEKWNEFLKDVFNHHPKKLLGSILSEKLPRRFVEGFINEYLLPLRETFASSISRKDREYIASLLGEGIPLTLLERRPGDEFVTAGGVSTDEIHPETMESKIHKNLYFAGEVLNVDGYTGGFSLQICWASGWVVGSEVSKFVEKDHSEEIR